MDYFIKWVEVRWRILVNIMPQPWIRRVWRLFIPFIPCRTSNLRHMKGCHRSRRFHTNPGPLEGLLNLNNLSSICSMAALSYTRGRYGGVYPRLGSYSNSYMALDWHLDVFILSQTPWVIASWTCLRASTSCLVVTNCSAGGQSTEFSPELNTGE